MDISGNSKAINGNKCCKAIGYRISAIGMWCSIIVLALLSAFSLIVTYSNGWGYRLSERLTHNYILNAPVMIAVALFSCCCIAGFVYFLSTVLYRRKIDKKTVLVIVCVLATAFQLWWVLAQHADANYYADSKMTMSIAEKFANGDMSIFDKSVDGVSIGDMSVGTQYLFYYPYQSGLISFFVLMFKIFGTNVPFAIQIANIISNTGVIVMLSMTGFLITDNDKMKIVIPITIGMCFPSLLYASFLYGNQIGFFFATMFIAMNAYALHKGSSTKKKIALIALSAIPMSLMMIIKSTFIIIAIAIAIIWLIELLLNTKIKNACFLIAFIIVMALSNTVSKLPQAYMENALGYSFGDGMPKTAWIAIGLQNDSVLEGMPGWWNKGALQRQKDTENDYTKQSQGASDDIKTELTRMVKNPGYAAWFFGKKLGSEWLTPDFQSRYFAGLGYEKIDGDSKNVHQFNLTDRDYSISDKKALKSERAIDQVEELMPFMDGYQSLIYIAAFVSCLAIVKKNKKEKDNINMAKLLLPCIFIVGAFVYMLWEAKAQYLLPFFMCLIPVAVPGIFSLVDNVIEKSHMTKISN